MDVVGITGGGRRKVGSEARDEGGLRGLELVLG